jgi:hypothetical protein
MTEATFIVDSSGEAVPNLQPGRPLRIAETAQQDLPIERLEIAKLEIHRARSARRVTEMLAEGRLLEEITETTRRETAARLEERSARLPKDSLDLVINARKDRRFAKGAPRMPRPSTRRKR